MRGFRIILITSTFLLLAGLGTVASFAFFYQDRILPSLSIGSVDVGGKTESEVRRIIQEHYNKTIKSGINVLYDKGQGNEEIVVVVPVQFDLDAAARAVMRYGKEGNYLNRGLGYFKLFRSSQHRLA